MGKKEEIQENQTKLQELLGKSVKVTIEKFQNWSTSRTIDDLLVVRPKTLDDVQSLVKAAKQLKLQIRCAGAFHSWANLFPDEGHILMYTRDLSRHDGPNIELIKREGCLDVVNVMSGVTVRQLMDFEIDNKINLMANVVLREPTYGGIVGGGCHGVGWDIKSVSDFCVSMRVVDSEGELRCFSKHDDPQMMKAVQCHLGMMGVIYDMQLEVEPERIVHTHNDFSITGEIFYQPKKLKELIETNDSVEIFLWPMSSVSWVDAAEHMVELIGIDQELTRDEWDPKKDGCWVRKINFADKSEVAACDIKGEVHYTAMNVKTWLEHTVQNVVDDFLVALPESLTPLAAKAALLHAKTTMIEDYHERLVKAIHFRDNIAMLSVSDMEWCFDADKNCSNVCKAVTSVTEIAQQYAEKGKFPLNIVIEMRWMGYSDAYLCPAIIGNPSEGGSGHTVYIEVLSYTNTPGWKEFSRKVSDVWGKIPGARPHWCKEWDNMDQTALKKSWTKQIKQFTVALDKSKMDPDGMFMNKMLQDIFYPGKKLSILEGGYAEEGNGVKNGGAKGGVGDNKGQEGDKKKSNTCVLL